MDGHDLVRSVKAVGVVGAPRGLRELRAAWRRQRDDAAVRAARGAERARVPGPVAVAEPGPGGGVLRFARSELRIVVTPSGAVFWGWDGAGPQPSYAVTEPATEPDPRALLEPGKDGGWQVVAERVTVVVSRHGAVEVHTPGGVRVRRDDPPRWFEPVAGGGDAGADGVGSAAGSRTGSGVGARWVQRSEVAADARFFGLGSRPGGPRLRDGSYRLWNTGPGTVPRQAGRSAPRPAARAQDTHGAPLSITMPLQLVVADAGTHLVFHDTTWDGTVWLREGVEGAGSGHDRAGSCELRMDGGPLRAWVALGSPARVLRTWAQLTGAPALPPGWALGHHHGLRGPAGTREARRLAAGHRARGLPLDAVHLDPGQGGAQGPAAGQEDVPGVSRLAEELAEEGVRLVSGVVPAWRAGRRRPVSDDGRAADPSAGDGLFVRDRAGRPVRGTGPAGDVLYPDFTDPRVRAWWGESYGGPLERGFAGFRHTGDEPESPAVFGEQTLPRSARHVLDGLHGDHRAAHNVYGLSMARAAHEGLTRLRPGERPFLVSRSGWAGMQRYGAAGFAAPDTGWPGLRAALSVVLGLGLCGVPQSGPLDWGDAVRPSPELYLRRLQLSAYLPLLHTASRAAASAGAAEPGAAPWEFGEEVLEHARVALDERHRLLPYLRTLAQLAHRTGAPWVRPLWWDSPEDRALRDCEDAFLLGDSLLVAPVLAPGTDRRAVRLPRGRWYDTATGEAYEGPAQVLVDAPLSRVPVLARGGAVIPVRGGDGGIVLEVWAPGRGRTGGGLVADDTAGSGRTGEAGRAGDAAVPAAAEALRALPEIERYTSLRAGGRVVLERDTDHGPRAPGRPVRVRGL